MSKEIIKKNCTLIILDEDNISKDFFCQEIIINNEWITFYTDNNKISIPISRVIKIKEQKNKGLIEFQEVKE